MSVGKPLNRICTFKWKSLTGFFLQVYTLVFTVIKYDYALFCSSTSAS